MTFYISCYTFSILDRSTPFKIKWAPLKLLCDTFNNLHVHTSFTTIFLLQKKKNTFCDTYTHEHPHRS